MSSSFSASKKPAARHPVLSLDFSPMSALGLLLVNFFMVQAMWKKPQVMPLTMPDNEFYGCGEMENDSKVLTLLCGPDKVYGYTGITEPKLDSVDYSAEGLRKFIVQNKERADRQFGPDEYSDVKTGALKKSTQLIVNIKPLPSSKYGNLVDVLDEMRICGVRCYTVTDPFPVELNLIREPQKGWYLGDGQW